MAFDIAQFARRLREERKRLGMSQKEFGAVGGVRIASQYLYEKGERTPSAEYLARVSAAGADFDYLVTGERSAQTGGNLWVHPEALVKILILVDRRCRDRHNRLLDLEYRSELTLALCRAVSGKEPGEIAWDALIAHPPEA